MNNYIQLDNNKYEKDLFKINFDFIKSKKLTYIILVIYLSYGLYKILNQERIPHNYMIISLFMAFKIIVNYYKCTISYIECRMRGVKKEEGYLFNFLNNFIELRYSKYFILLILYYIYLNYYYFRTNKRCLPKKIKI